MNEFNRRHFLTASAATASGALGLSALEAGPAAAAAPSGVSGVNVRDYGAAGDGATDDSLAVRKAIDIAAGDTVYFPAGTYVLDNVTVLTVADLVLSMGATLLHKSASTSGWMITLAGTSLRIRGGVLDGNKANQIARPSVIVGGVPSGTQIELSNVHVKNSVNAAVYVNRFGGQIDINHCLFTDQAEHDGVAGHSTAILSVVAAQAGSKGVVRFNHNRAIGTNSPRVPGSNPGGVFFGPNISTVDGSLATIEAIGNHFWGYGQNCAGNLIGSLHTYPAVAGARYIGNYFEACSFSAISAKSVQDFVCSSNVILNGQTSTANVAIEGAIGYAPSYHAGSNLRQRAVIQGNIVTNPGGQPGVAQNGIAVMGSVTSPGLDVVVSGNVLTGCGMGILVNATSELLIDSNVITTVVGSDAGTFGGIRVSGSVGPVAIRGNRIVSNAGLGIAALSGLSASRLTVQNNSITHTVRTSYAVSVAGAEFAHFSGNEIDSPVLGVTVRGLGSTKLGGFYWDKSNMIYSGNFYPVYAQITNCFGDQKYTGSPVGVVTPGEVGTQYTQLNGQSGNVFWIATGTTSTAWRLLT